MYFGFTRSRPLGETPAGHIVGYHGSHNRFEKPTQTIRESARGIDFGPGFYFTTDERDASEYGPFVYRADLNVQNPFRVYRSTVNDPFLKELQKVLRVSDEDMSFCDDSHPLRCLMGYAQTLIEMRAISVRKLQDFFRKHGYDGLIIDSHYINVEHGGPKFKGDYVVVFDAGQIETWQVPSKPVDIWAPR